MQFDMKIVVPRTKQRTVACFVRRIAIIGINWIEMYALQ
jgi:hypothetical protein